MGCAACGKGTVRLGRAEMKRSIAGHVFVATVQARTCADCGEVFFADADVERVDLAVASALVASGIASGAAFKFVRKVVGIRAAELASLLSVTPETISRWETDKVPIDYGARALLAMMLDDRATGGANRTQDALRALAEPKRLGKRIALKLAS